ncbi:hypothetical protein QBC46DRAFT_323168 [Diplogelasinospora grovesii]|uniref:NmrA-like domain-containing protein n=1 Tax=Diplogelasinospora grovesii TaxID=303347 RepID=A0AAN6MXX4_9PEZI|nr:hypothetical protein QBC46DRAFT_323168 [Diplogelasinospora grovesii]
MSNLIVVIGATGGQGGGVADAFLTEPGWRVRGTTRNTSSEKARALAAKGVEMVSANLNDEGSLERAFQGATAIFAFTDYYDTFFDLGHEKSSSLEFEQGKRIARAAAKIQSLQRLILSCGPHTSLITQGEAVCPHLEGKGRIVTHITNEMPDLAAKTTFVVFTIFANNPLLYDIFRPIYVPSAKKYVTMYPVPPNTPYPCVGDHAVNGAIFVRRFIKNPPPQGSFVRCSVETLTIDSYLALWGRATSIAPEEGSTAAVQISPEDYIRLWGPMAEEQASQWRFFHWVAEHGPPKWEGITLVEGMDLLTDEDKKELLSVEESLKLYDWSSFEKKPTASSAKGRFASQ